MKTIFYGVNGEGLGHISRALAVIDYLPEYEVHIFTFGKALKFLVDMGYPFVHEIEGMMFQYNRGRVDYLLSGFGACKYFALKLGRNISKIKSLASRLRPVLYITDYEPSVSRVAEKGKLISIDNQHRFMYCNLRDLSWLLRFYAASTGLFTRMLVPRFDHAIISAFHSDRVEVNHPNVSMVEGLVRKSAEERTVSNNGFVLVYLRSSISDVVLSSLLPVSREVRVYGAIDSDVKSQCGSNFKFFPLSHKFVDDLVSCDCIVSTAGHQLLTEARFFGKSILTVPEPMQYEQYINAEYAERTGFGVKCYANRLSAQVVEDFVGRTLVHTRVANGVHKVRRILDNFLS